MESSGRAHVAFVIAVLSISVTPAATGPFTEAEAIRLFLEQSPLARRVPLVERSVETALLVEARVANPEVAFQVEDAGGVRDEFLIFQQQLPISGHRGLLRERATIASAAAGLAAEEELQADAYELKRSFHEILYRQLVLEQIRHGTELLGQAVEILEQRELAGEGSGYDFLRGQQELAETRVTATKAEADLAEARTRFGAFYARDSNMASARIEGDLTPDGPVPEVEKATEQALAQRLDLRSLSTGREGLELERRAARRRRVPEPTLTAGWKRTEALGHSDNGYFAAVAVPLPIFRSGRLDTARAVSEGERIELEIQLLTRRIRADVEAAVTREQAARSTARAYGGDVEERAAELHKIARLMYDEGESGILELLDAHRTSLTMELRALSARYEVKIAEIDRQRVIGNEVQP